MVTSALYLVARVRVLTADAMVLLGHCYVVARVFWVVTSALYLVARVRVLTADARVLLGRCYVVARVFWVVTRRLYLIDRVLLDCSTSVARALLCGF